MNRLSIVTDEFGNQVVVIPNIIFKNKQNIDWNEVEKYLKQFVGEIICVADTKDVVYLGKEFPDEFAGSKYTRSAKGTRAKVKANAAQGIREMVETATDKAFRENHKAKHSTDAANGWYYYTTRFALPVYSNDNKLDEYNVYSGCLVVNCNSSGKMFLYDLVGIKKKQVTHSRLTSRQVVQNCFSFISIVTVVFRFVNSFFLEVWSREPDRGNDVFGEGRTGGKYVQHFAGLYG